MLLTFELDFLPIDVSNAGATVRMRERIRSAIASQVTPVTWTQPITIEIDAWHVRPFDLDNVAKQILDALSSPLAERDGSTHMSYATLPDDDVRYVSAVYIRGTLGDRTCIRVRVAPTHFEEILRDP
jgi:hypothetical protein